MSTTPSLERQPSSTSVLVVGATRGTGRLVVEALLARGTRVRVAARNHKKARALFGDRVEHVHADLLHELPAQLFDGVGGVIFTAAVPPRPAGAALVRATEVEGVRAVVNAARRVGFDGRFLYLTTIGVTKPNWMMSLLGLVKRGTLSARREAEAILADSGLDVTIVRAATLTNAPEGRSPVVVVRGDLAMAPTRTVSRADVARVLVESLSLRTHEVSVLASPSAEPLLEQLRALAS
jgi:uncharacterized protein YbjT (DUF2867 family)